MGGGSEPSSPGQRQRTPHSGFRSTQVHSAPDSAATGGAAAAAAAFVLLGSTKDKFVYPQGSGSAAAERRLYMRTVSSSVLAQLQRNNSVPLPSSAGGGARSDRAVPMTAPSPTSMPTGNAGSTTASARATPRAWEANNLSEAPTTACATQLRNSSTSMPPTLER